jgi:putative membrane protein insertion efficiency factor
MMRLRGVLWTAGGPARMGVIGLIRLYRVVLGGMLGGNCRFHPSCSHYAEMAVRQVGVLRGVPLALWRVLRCQPFSRGGVDYPPVRPLSYDADIHGEAA